MLVQPLPFLHFNQVSKIYPVRQSSETIAIHNLSLSIYSNDFVAVCGPSGSGKSTLLALAGLITEPSSGEIFLQEKEVNMYSEQEKTKLRSHLFGFMYQFASLIPTLTVVENVLLPKVLQGKVKKGDWERAKKLIDKVGLKDNMNLFSYQLSGGEQRRVALARALMNKPRLLLADEPTGALDGQTAQLIMRIFQEEHQQGLSIIMVTHDVHIASWASRQLYLVDGVLQE